MGEVSPLNQLYARYRAQGFEFFTVYVREPHPGEHYGPHRSWEQKLEFARACRAQDGIQTPLLVDDLAGTVHHLYGSMPNMVYVIGKDGRIVYKAIWTDHAEIEEVLENLVLADRVRAQGLRLKPSYTEKITYIPADYAPEVREVVFDRAGPKAGEDYRRVYPSTR
ncbi:MAG: hypothetical protein HY690_11525 [Chloroflexi bacterium]|nr:hypothetical protein [Chloroflexota bacterium]